MKEKIEQIVQLLSNMETSQLGVNLMCKEFNFTQINVFKGNVVKKYTLSYNAHFKILSFTKIFREVVLKHHYIIWIDLKVNNDSSLFSLMMHEELPF